jgi:hypothetical protein
MTLKISFPGVWITIDGAGAVTFSPTTDEPEIRLSHGAMARLIEVHQRHYPVRP